MRSFTASSARVLPDADRLDGAHVASSSDTDRRYPKFALFHVNGICLTCFQVRIADNSGRNEYFKLRALGNGAAYVSAVRQRADGRSRITKSSLRAEWSLFVNIAAPSK
jgi:hypothetical protein